jgi:hypothetical protein
MSGRKIVALLVVAAAAYYFYTHRSGSAGPSLSASSHSSVGNTSPGNDCLARAEAADREVSTAAGLATHTPVDPGAWQSAETSALGAISYAESGCSTSAGGNEGDAVVELRAALASMRSLMEELSTAAKGTGGAAGAARTMEDIDNHLEKARSLLH